MESPSILGAALTMIIGHLLKKNNLDQLASLACAIRGTNHTQGTLPSTLALLRQPTGF